MHCTFCPSDELAKPRQHVSDADLRSMLHQAHDLGLKAPVQFNVLGEPLLNPKVYDYFALCEELGFTVILITNISLLQDKRLERILQYGNVVLVLSLQTPTAESYKIRKYDKISGIEEYLELVTNAVRKKFALKSLTRIEIHVAADLDDHSLSRDDASNRLWQVFRDEDEQLEFLKSYISAMQALGKEMSETHPEFYRTELQRARSFFGYAYADGIVSESPDRLLIAPNQLTDKDFWGWMCAPNVFLRIKRFGFWAKQRPFLDKHLEADETLYIEERTELFDCEMAHNISMLADGSFSLCCVDYEGEMQMGNIKSNSLQSILASSRRRETTRNAMVHRICRECQGNAHVFKKSPVKEPEQTVAHFGFGWHAYEPDLGGMGGHWTAEAAHAYLYPRLRAHSMEIEFFSPHPSTEAFSLDLCEQAADGEFRFLSSEVFFGKQGELSRVAIPLELAPFRLYRATIGSRTFIPADETRNYSRVKQARNVARNLVHLARSFRSGAKPFEWRPYRPNGDTRHLGLAVCDLRLKGEVIQERVEVTNLVQITSLSREQSGVAVQS